MMSTSNSKSPKGVCHTEAVLNAAPATGFLCATPSRKTQSNLEGSIFLYAQAATFPLHRNPAWGPMIPFNYFPSGSQNSASESIVSTSNYNSSDLFEYHDPACYASLTTFGFINFNEKGSQLEFQRYLKVS